ncbi:trigger factor [Bacteroidota bacterium]
MNITQEQTGDLTATIKIELEPADYAEKVKTVLKDYQKKANLPGFRPGKVPFGMVKKMYGKPVMAEEINKLISESLNNYIVEDKINILGNPLPNLEKTQTVDFDQEINMDFYFDIGIIPEINVIIDENIKLDFYDIQADDKTVEKFIIDIQKRQGQPEAVEVSEEEDIIRGEISEPDVDIPAGTEPKITTISASFIKKKSEKAKFIGIKVGDIISFNPLKATENNTEAAHIVGADKNDEEKLDKNKTCRTQ